MTLPRMTPEQEAAYAFEYGLKRSDLKPEVQVVYDRLLEERRLLEEHRAELTPEPKVPARSSPEVRARILEMFKRGNRKYALPFEKDRLAMASFLGGNWEEYGQIILQMAILDTLLSIEEQLAPSPLPPLDAPKAG